jgi:hypothetical protein
VCTRRKKAERFGRNCLLKLIAEKKIEENVHVTGRRRRRLSSYWMTFRKREGTGN